MIARRVRRTVHHPAQSTRRLAPTPARVASSTPSCPPPSESVFHWQTLHLSVVPSVPVATRNRAVCPGSSAALTIVDTRRIHNEVNAGRQRQQRFTYGRRTSATGRFYAASSPSRSCFHNLVRGRSPSRRVRFAAGKSRALGSYHMASNDSLVARSDEYRYQFWRPRRRNFEPTWMATRKRDADRHLQAVHPTPLLPALRSNHGSGSNERRRILSACLGAPLAIRSPWRVPPSQGYVPTPPVSIRSRAISATRGSTDGIRFPCFDQLPAPIWGHDIATYIYSTTSGARPIPTTREKLRGMTINELPLASSR